jgi:SAM-dependent methyltransferase
MQFKNMAWYHTFFEGIPQRAWKLGQNEEHSEFEAEFLWDVMNLDEGSRVLDVFSGYGRHAVPLARNKVEVWCVDISSEYCEELTVVSREEHLGIQVLCGDFLVADLPPVKMDAAYCLGNSLSFFDRENMIAFFEKISSGLKEGGMAVLHSGMLAESVLPTFQENTWMEVGEGDEKITYLVHNEYDVVEGVIKARLTYLDANERHSYEIQQCIYTLSELKSFSENAGMEVTEVFSAIDGEPFRLGDEEAFILLKKK